MRMALLEAHLALAEDEVPIGAVLVSNGAVVARAHNRPVSLNDPTAHAEILAVRKAALLENNYRLPNTVLYVTVEPCWMCAGALLHARVKKVVFGAPDPRGGAYGGLNGMPSVGKLVRNVEIVPGVLEGECRELLQTFFSKKR